MVMVDHAYGSCPTDADQLAAPVSIPANQQDLNPDITIDTSLDLGFLDNFDIDEFMRSVGDLPSTSTDPCVLPAVTDTGAYLDADAVGSSFFGQMGSQYNGVGTGQMASSSLHRGCMEPADSFITGLNQSYAAC